ncbi:MAG: hypothetical protein ACTSYD_00770 [Candidatus Heimdallarchaeaceae archaeon]
MDISNGTKAFLPWQQAQKAVAKVLDEMDIEHWIEQPINNYRIDVLAKHQVGNKTYCLIFEVKHYLSVTASKEEQFEQQLTKYVIELIKKEMQRKSIKTILNQYTFVGYLVLGNDYGLIRNRKLNWRKKTYLRDAPQDLKKIWDRNVFFFCSTIDHIKGNLHKIGLASKHQAKLSTFLDSND